MLVNSLCVNLQYFIACFSLTACAQSKRAVDTYISQVYVLIGDLDMSLLSCIIGHVDKPVNNDVMF